MKYTSLIDLLELSLDDISNLDANGIIRLQKQLKARAMLEDATNIGELSKIIDNLKDDSIKQCYIFIEKHLWLKKLISGNHKKIALKEIDVNSLLINDLDTLKFFLYPYLKENLKVFLADSLSVGKYEHIQRILSHNYLFTEETNQLAINFFRARLNYAISYISEGKLKEKQFPINYISIKTFVKCLNVYPDNFNVEINELNSEVIDVYNLNRKKTERQEFKFAARVMVALSILDTSNVFLKDTLESNAKIAREHTLPKSQRKKSSGFSGWQIALTIFLIVRVIVWVSKGVSNSTPDYNPYDYENINSNSGLNDGHFNAIDSMLREIRKGKASSEDLKEVLNDVSDPTSKKSNSNTNKYKRSNHIRFIYTMKRKVERKTFTDTSPKNLEPFSNPYPLTFNAIPYVENNTGDGSYVRIKNKSKKDLIIFKLTNGINQSIYIPENKEVSIVLKAQDSVVFYAGKDFVETRFSHFKTKADLSSMYKFENYKSSNIEIIVKPFRDKVTKRTSRTTKKEIIDSSRIDKIETKNLKLSPLSINNLYTDFYNKNYRN